MIHRFRRGLIKASNGNYKQALIILMGILGLIFYISGLVVRSFYSVSIPTQDIELGTMINAAEKNVVIIREEIPIYAPSTGIVDFLYNEGEKAKKGNLVAEIRGSEVADSYKYRLKVIDAKINEVVNKVPVENTQEELDRLNSRLEYLYAEVQNRIFNEDYSYIEDLKDEIVTINDEKRFIEENGIGSTKTLEELEAERQEILSMIQASNSAVVAPITGLVVPYADGFESELSIENMYNLTVSDLEKYKDKSVVDLRKAVNAGDPIGKVVNNDKWYIACEVDKEDIDRIATEKLMYIYIEDNKIPAYLEEFHKGSDDKFIGFFRIETETFKFYEKRVFPARLEYNYSEGIMIPKSAVITNEAGRVGAYVLDKSNSARFRYIENILDENEEYYCCKNVSSSNSVSLYDKVILNPKGVVEGQKVA